MSKNNIKYLVEAAGIEPASESSPAEASTSLVLIWLFVGQLPQDRILPSLAHVSFPFPLPKHTGEGSLFLVAPSSFTGKNQRDGYCLSSS